MSKIRVDEIATLDNSIIVPLAEVVLDADLAPYIKPDSPTGAITIPVGTTAERPANGVGKFRYNSTLGRPEVNNGTSWGSLGGATGAGSDDVFYENSKTITASYTVSTNKNAMTAGPVTLDVGVSVTVPAGSAWTVV